MSNNDEKPRKTWVMFKKAVEGIALSSLPIGTLVKDPNSTFLGVPVIWKVADINHQGYPANSITLISDKILAARPFDAEEQVTNRWSGNSRYSLSNIRQWLNSDAEAGKWYVQQHTNDKPPAKPYANYNTYAEDAGFLNQFSIDFKNALIPTELIVPLHKTDGTGYDTIVDKVFLATTAEIGLAYEYSYIDGYLLAVFNSSDSSRYATGTQEAYDDSLYPKDFTPIGKPWRWWLRMHWKDGTDVAAIMVGTNGKRDSRATSSEFGGVRPLCNIPSTVRVSETPDENGVYTIVQFK